MPASTHLAVTTRPGVPSRLTTPIPGRRRTAAAVVAAVAGGDGSRPMLARTRRTGAPNRPAAGGGS
jgi:hypothetical protein